MGLFIQTFIVAFSFIYEAVSYRTWVNFISFDAEKGSWPELEYDDFGGFW